jgi:hypothetical protein
MIREAKTTDNTQRIESVAYQAVAQQEAGGIVITKQIAPGVYEARHGNVVAYAEFLSAAMILAWRLSCAST